MDIFEFILICISLTCALFTGAVIGRQRAAPQVNNTSGTACKKRNRRKSPDDNIDKKIAEINRIMNDVENYDGRPPVTKGGVL